LLTEGLLNEGMTPNRCSMASMVACGWRIVAQAAIESSESHPKLVC